MTTKQAIGYAAVGFILYELWKRNQQAQLQAQAGAFDTFRADTTSPFPVWGQQLSAVATSTTTESSVLDDLMNIPQGPGGSPSYWSPGGFFGGADCILPPANFNAPNTAIFT